jgi:hypothetical protein
MGFLQCLPRSCGHELASSSILTLCTVHILVGWVFSYLAGFACTSASWISDVLNKVGNKVTVGVLVAGFGSCN